jgi:hypothetical protein
MLTNREFVKAGSELVVSQWKLVSVPWDIFRHYLSFCATVLLEVLVWLGAKPHNYRTPAEKQQQAAVIEHLQKSVVALTNEQKALLADVERLRQDKRRAIAKLHRARTEAAEMEAALQAAQQQTPELQGRPLPMRPPSARAKMGVHVLSVVAALCAWWLLLQDIPSLERKVLVAWLFPTAWITMMAWQSPRHHWSLTYVNWSSWFLIGFSAAYRLRFHTAGS